MLSQLLSRVLILVLGTLYPAYSSYKAVRTKNVREYVKWMMYWVVFALFTSAETFGDVFLSWLPLYYEIKIGFLIWLLAPATKGSSILYRKFVHPYLAKNEKEIDDYIERASQNGVGLLRRAGQRGLQAVATGVVQSNVVNMGQTYIQQQLQNVLPPTAQNAPVVVPAGHQQHQPQPQPLPEHQSAAAHAPAQPLPASALSSTGATSDMPDAGGAAVIHTSTISDYPPPYTAPTGASHPIKTEPLLDDGTGGTPLTPPLNRSRPATQASAAAESSVASHSTAAGATTTASRRNTGRAATTKSAAAGASKARSRTTATTGHGRK